MISPDIIEAIEAVDSLNVDYYDATQDEERLPFDFVYATYWYGIKYFDETVWDDNDYGVETKDIEDADGNVIGEEREPIEACVRRRVKEIQEITRRFKL